MTPAESFIERALAAISSPITPAAVELLKEAIELLAVPKTSVPVDEILALYHKLLPSLPKVLRLNDKRRRQLVARWNESEDQQSLDFWAGYFNQVAASDFLSGRSSAWSATFDWLTNPSNMLKVREGNYRNKASRSDAVAAANHLFDSVRLEQNRRLGGR